MLGTNSFTFRHQGAILREFNKKQRFASPTVLQGLLALTFGIKAKLLKQNNVKSYILLTVHLDIYSFKEEPNFAQFIFSVFCQTPLHVSRVSTANHQEVQPYGYNSKYQLFYPMQQLVLIALFR